IFRREKMARIKGETERCGVGLDLEARQRDRRASPTLAEALVDDGLAMSPHAVGPTVEAARPHLRDEGRRQVLAPPNALVDGRPERAGGGRKCQPNRVA